MSGPKPTIRPSHAKSNLLTNCKFCRAGIYRGRDEYVWLTKPMGYSHKSCAERAERDRVAHRLADVAHQLARKVRSEELDAVARWLCGELDGLGRWQLLFMLAAMVDVERSPGELLAWFWERERGAA